MLVRDILSQQEGKRRMDYKIVHLLKSEWEGYRLPLNFTTNEYYDVSIKSQADGYTVSMKKTAFDQPVSHTQEEHDFPDKLYDTYRPNACAWGVIQDGELIAAIETEAEEWNNRLRITELCVSENYQKQGLGHALMEVAKEQARLEHRRAIILETLSCNVNAIGFYLHEG